MSFSGYLLQTHWCGVHVHKQPGNMRLDQETLRDTKHHRNIRRREANIDGQNHPFTKVCAL